MRYRLARSQWTTVCNLCPNGNGGRAGGRTPTCWFPLPGSSMAFDYKSSPVPLWQPSADVRAGPESNGRMHPCWECALPLGYRPTFILAQNGGVCQAPALGLLGLDLSGLWKLLDFLRLMAESLKVPKAEFERVIRSLLNAPPMPASEIPRSTSRKRRLRSASSGPAGTRLPHHS